MRGLAESSEGPASHIKHDNYDVMRYPNSRSNYTCAWAGVKNMAPLRTRQQTKRRYHTIYMFCTVSV